MYQLIEVAGGSHHLTRLNDRTASGIKGHRELILDDMYALHVLIYLDAVDAGRNLESIIVVVGIELSCRSILYPEIIILGTETITVDVAPVAILVNLLGKTEVAVGGIGVGIIIATPEVNVDVILLVIGVIGELRTLRLPSRLAVGCTEQIEVGCSHKVSGQGHVVAWHDEGVNTVGIGGERRGLTRDIIGIGHRVEDVTIGRIGLESYRLALVGHRLPVEVGIAVEEVEATAVRRIGYRVNHVGFNKSSRNFHVGCRHLKAVVVAEVTSVSGIQYSDLVGGQISYCHLVDAVTIHSAHKEGHIVIML